MIYSENLHEFAENLVDCKLNVTQMDSDMFEATYLFKNRKNQVFAFSIKSRQAIDPQEQSEWGIWFGPITHSAIENQINAIFEYLKMDGGPDLLTEIL